jgi:predicted choloylglycine hydrolase
VRYRVFATTTLTGLVLLAVTSSSLFVAATWGDGPLPPAVRTDDAPEAVRDRLRIVDSVPVLRVSGTPREMGFQHGAALRRQIHFLHAEYYEAMVKRLVSEPELREWAQATEPFIPERYREEMRGLAEGCGLPYEQILIVNTMLDRFQTVMCSTVVSAGGASKDGEVYFGRNLDFPGRNVLQRMTIVLVWEPAEGTPLASVTWPGVLGVLSGMNAHGVAGATMLVHRGRDLRPGLPYLLMYREALEGARTAADVGDAIGRAKRTCSNNFMVVDAAGAAQVVEYDPETVVRRPAAKGGLCSTNFFASAELRDHCLPMGKERFDTLAEFLDEEHGRIDLARVRRALEEVATPWYMNVQSMVFLPARQSLHLSVGGDLPAAKQRFVHLPRELLFGRP